MTTPASSQSSSVYHEYIQRRPLPQQLDAMRKEQLQRIEAALDCRVIVYASKITPLPPPFTINVVYEDLLPFSDLLNGLHGERIAVVLETPGGDGATARDMVEILHERFRHVMFVVPGMAKSAGTIMALGGHQIFMGSSSSLGPIDAQLSHNGKSFSADEFVTALEAIKRETEESGKLSLAYVPFLQRLSPGEIEHAKNALQFAKDAVTGWLAKYKFADWNVRNSTGEEVTDEMRHARAELIANNLANQSKWRSHGRSLRIKDLRELKVKIDDYRENPELNDAVSRYYALLRTTFDTGGTYKIFETTRATVARFMPPPVTHAQKKPPVDPKKRIVIGVDCPRCGNKIEAQLDFVKGLTRKPGVLQFPDSGKVTCKHCSNIIDLGPVRANLERQLGRPALNPQPSE